VLNRYSMALYNKMRFRKYSAWHHTETTGLKNFFHPLDSIGNWNRLYGKRGFFQYQCLFPDSPDVLAQMQTFLAALHSKQMFSFLAVIKYHRRGKGLLTFSQNGYSIALDFPNTAQVRAVLPQLNRWVADNGGRVYLAKDAVLSAEHFRIMYGKAATDWESVINQIDAGAKFTSLMSQRLEWKRRE
jgi:decaprenylphospho-beta-D-ribofuranose 2-oxidase